MNECCSQNLSWEVSLVTQRSYLILCKAKVSPCSRFVINLFNWETTMDIEFVFDLFLPPRLISNVADISHVLLLLIPCSPSQSLQVIVPRQSPRKAAFTVWVFSVLFSRKKSQKPLKGWCIFMTYSWKEQRTFCKQQSGKAGRERCRQHYLLILEAKKGRKQTRCPS